MLGVHAKWLIAVAFKLPMLGQADAHGPFPSRCSVRHALLRISCHWLSNPQHGSLAYMLACGWSAFIHAACLPSMLIHAGMHCLQTSPSQGSSHG